MATAVKRYIDESWFSIDERTFNRLDEDWDHNVSEVAIAIAGIAREAREFKIGITVDPKWCWFTCAGGAYSKRFTKMTLVYVANSSKPKHRHSTGNMEIAQIEKFKYDDRCLNVADGGETPSGGSPHFCYVVSN